MAVKLETVFNVTEWESKKGTIAKILKKETGVTEALRKLALVAAMPKSVAAEDFAEVVKQGKVDRTSNKAPDVCFLSLTNVKTQAKNVMDIAKTTKNACRDSKLIPHGVGDYLDRLEKAAKQLVDKMDAALTDKSGVGPSIVCS